VLSLLNQAGQPYRFGDSGSQPEVPAAVAQAIESVGGADH
jgi:hypothetical protein